MKLASLYAPTSTPINSSLRSVKVSSGDFFERTDQNSFTNYAFERQVHARLCRKFTIRAKSNGSKPLPRQTGPHLCRLCFPRFFKHVERHTIPVFIRPWNRISGHWCWSIFHYLAVYRPDRLNDPNEGQKKGKKEIYDPLSREISLFNDGCHRLTRDLGQDRNSIWKRDSRSPGQSRESADFYERLGDIKFNESRGQNSLSLASRQSMLSIYTRLVLGQNPVSNWLELTIRWPDNLLIP